MGVSRGGGRGPEGGPGGSRCLDRPAGQQADSSDRPTCPTVPTGAPTVLTCTTVPNSARQSRQPGLKSIHD
eukprot:6140335-Prymnesium_polylepis.1